MNGAFFFEGKALCMSLSALCAHSYVNRIVVMKVILEAEIVEISLENLLNLTEKE